MMENSKGHFVINTGYSYLHNIPDKPRTWVQVWFECTVSDKACDSMDYLVSANLRSQSD